MLSSRAGLSRPKQPLRHSTSGFGLIESLIVAAVVSLLAVGVFTFYSSVSAKTKAHETTQAVLELRQSIHKAYVASANFSGVTNASVVAEQLLPSGLEVTGPASGPEIVAPYGGTILVAAAMVDGVPARGLGLTLNQVPRKLCPQIVASLAVGNFRNITINDSSVLGANGLLQQDLLTQLCSASPESTIALTVADKQTDAALELGICTAPSPSTQTVTDDCPAGHVGSITKTRSAACAPGSLVAEWGPWNEINTCQPACAPDPASPQTRTTTPCPAGQIGAITEQRISACATGQLTGAPSWSEWTEISNTCAPQCMAPADEIDTATPCPVGQVGTIVRRRQASCPAATGPYEWGEWEETENTCRPACVAPAPETTTETRPQNCGPGRTTPSGGTSFTQSRTVTTTYTCPASTGSPVGTESASGWSPLESSACQQACTPPASHSETRTSTPCPTGQAGVITERRTTSYSCQAPTGLPIESISPWETVSNTCQKVCVLPSPPTETEVSPPKVAYWNKPIVCWYGWSGSEQNRTLYMHRNEVQTRTRNASCATGDVSWSAWSAWSEYTAVSDWVAYSDPCPGRHKCIVPDPQNVVAFESRTAQCGPFRYNINNGSSTFTQTRWVTTMYYCASSYGEPQQYVSAEEWAPLEIYACR